jgi:hypothetical protein
VFKEERVRRKLAASDDGDRRMVKILAAVLIDGLPAVETACLQALSEGSLRPTSSSTSSRVSAIRGQRRQSRHPTLGHTPVADCASYDRTEVLDLMSGVVEDIIGALSRIRWLFVIAQFQLHLQRSCGRCEAGRA